MRVFACANVGAFMEDFADPEFGELAAAGGKFRGSFDGQDDGLGNVDAVGSADSGVSGSFGGGAHGGEGGGQKAEEDSERTEVFCGKGMDLFHKGVSLK